MAMPCESPTSFRYPTDLAILHSAFFEIICQRQSLSRTSQKLMMLIEAITKARRWEVGGESESIKRPDSGWGLGAPSVPPGHPDNNRLFLFKRWHVDKLFGLLSFLGLSENIGPLYVLWPWFILSFFCERFSWLASCFYTTVSWEHARQDATIWYRPLPSCQLIHVCIVKPQKLWLYQAVKTTQAWQHDKRCVNQTRLHALLC